MSQLEELKKIIVGENADDVAKLSQRLEDVASRTKDVEFRTKDVESRTKDIAEVLPTAIEQRIEQDDKLAQSLQKPISASIKSSIQREPKEYADILYPIMSPAIRLSISSAIRSMLTTINQTVESATSIKGWRWRMEAMKTGVPYAEVALRHALLYRVEQVFLIDKESGLLISNLVNEDVIEKDSDAVSAMFTAIQSFVQDSFSDNQEDQLTDMSVGEHRVWIAHGPKAMLACVIRGMAPASLRTQLIEILEHIQVDYRKPLSVFNGDASGFVGIENYLEPCLSLKLKDYDGERKRLPLGSILGACLLLGLVAYWLFSSMQQRSQLDYVSKTLRDTPGVLVTNVYWQDGKLQVYGLKDPFAQLPLSRFEQLGIAKEKIDFQLKPYRSLENDIVIKRYREQYKVPEDVQLNIENRTLFFSGATDLQFLNKLPMHESDVFDQFETQALVATGQSINSYVKQHIELPKNIKLMVNGRDIVVSGDADVDWVKKLKRLFKDNTWVTNVSLDDSAYLHQIINDIAALSFVFADKLDMQEQMPDLLNTTSKKIKDVLALAKKLGLQTRVNVVGFTDDVGSETLNRQLRTERAQKIIQQLVSYGIPETILTVKNMPERQAITKERSARIYIKAQSAN